MLIKITDKNGNEINSDYEKHKANNKLVLTDASGNTTRSLLKQK